VAVVRVRLLILRSPRGVSHRGVGDGECHSCRASRCRSLRSSWRHPTARVSQFYPRSGAGPARGSRREPLLSTSRRGRTRRPGHGSLALAGVENRKVLRKLRNREKEPSYTLYSKLSTAKLDRAENAPGRCSNPRRRHRKEETLLPFLLSQLRCKRTTAGKLGSATARRAARKKLGRDGRDRHGATTTFSRSLNQCPVAGEVRHAARLFLDGGFDGCETPAGRVVLLNRRAVVGPVP